MGFLDRKSLFKVEAMLIKIQRGTLEFALNVSREMHPKEFIGKLRIIGDLITEVIIEPDLMFRYNYASVFFHMNPIDTTLKGCIHSHPDGSLKPTVEDLTKFFFGKANVIIAYPYNLSTVACYKSSGEPIKLKII